MNGTDLTKEMALERTRRRINVALSLGALLAGVAVAGWLVRARPEPPKQIRTVHALEVLAVPIEQRVEASPVVGYGTVGPKHEVDIIPQVNGRLLHVHGDLGVGKIISQGELLFEIDPALYASRVEQVKAEVRRLESVLTRYDQELLNLDERIANAKRMLSIEEENYLATKALYENEKVGTPQQVAADEQRCLRQKDAVADLKDRRAMVPHLKIETQAQLDAAHARLEQAEYELTNTRIVCPFEARVEAVSAYTSQVVSGPFSIATLTDMEAFEISVGIDPRELRWLADAAQPEALEQSKPHRLEAGATGKLKAGATGELEAGAAEAVVRSTLHGREYTWRGFVTRFERVDEATRTARMVVEVRKADMVSQPLAGPQGTVSRLTGMRSGARRHRLEAGATTTSHERGLSLSIGMYCRTELPAKQLDDALLVPRHAIHENQWVYVFEPDQASGNGRSGHLGIRRVPLLRTVGRSVLVDYDGRPEVRLCELKPGEQVVVSPLLKPVVGMPVRLRGEDRRARFSQTLEGHAAVFDRDISGPAGKVYSIASVRFPCADAYSQLGGLFCNPLAIATSPATLLGQSCDIRLLPVNFLLGDR